MYQKRTVYKYLGLLAENEIAICTRSWTMLKIKQNLNPILTHEEISSLQPMFPSKRFDNISPLIESMLRRFACVQIEKKTTSAFNVLDTPRQIPRVFIAAGEGA